MNYIMCSDGTVRIWSDTDAELGQFRVLEKDQFDQLRKLNPDVVWHEDKE